MVGRLNLTHVCDGDPLERSRTDRGLDRGLDRGPDRGLDRGLDSPDSGLPSSPSPSAWLLPADKAASPESEDEGRGSGVPVVAGSVCRLQPLSFGEGIELRPLPPQQIRYTSSVLYDSDRHFIQAVALQPTGRALERCSQTVMAAPHSTWRRYKTQLEFTPRQRPQRFRVTTIVYAKTARAACSTELSYDRQRLSNRFLSSLELEAAPQ